MHTMSYWMRQCTLHFGMCDAIADVLFTLTSNNVRCFESPLPIRYYEEWFIIIFIWNNWLSYYVNKNLLCNLFFEIKLISCSVSCKYVCPIIQERLCVYGSLTYYLPILPALTILFIHSMDMTYYILHIHR